MNTSTLGESPLIRTAYKSDLHSILQLYAQPQADDGKVLDLKEAEMLFDRMQRYPDYHLYVAEVGRQIVGSFALLIMENLAHLGAPSGIVEDVVVSPSHHRQGVGRSMMRYAIGYCGDRGCYKLTLSANLVRKKAHIFYERLGFERHGYSFCMKPEPKSCRSTIANCE